MSDLDEWTWPTRDGHHPGLPEPVPVDLTHRPRFKPLGCDAGGHYAKTAGRLIDGAHLWRCVTCGATRTATEKEWTKP